MYHLRHWNWCFRSVFCSVDYINHTLVGGVSVNSLNSVNKSLFVFQRWTKVDVRVSNYGQNFHFSRLRGGEEILNKVIISVFFVHQKYSRSFVKLWLNYWCHMDYFDDVLTTFLGLYTFQLHCCLWRVRKLSDFIKNILICVPKMSKGLMVLERHAGE